MHAYTTGESRTAALGAIAVLAVVLAIAANRVSDQVELGPAWLISPPAVAASYGLIYKLVDRYAWRSAFLRKLGFIDVPDVEGTYEGELVSSYIETKMPVRVSIDQTWTHIAIRFETGNPTSSTSYSIAAALGRSGHDEARLTYTYRNQTRPGVAEVDMNDHDGTAELCIEPIDGKADGRYFNFRGRQGTLVLTRI